MRISTLTCLLFWLLLGSFVENACWGQIKFDNREELAAGTDFLDPAVNSQYYIIGLDNGGLRCLKADNANSSTFAVLFPYVQIIVFRIFINKIMSIIANNRN